MKMKIFVLILIFYSGNGMAYGELVDNHDWSKTVSWSVLAFFCILGMLSVAALFESWKNAWRLPLVIYAIYSFPIDAPTIIYMDCNIWRESIMQSALAMGLIVMVIEMKSIKTLADRIKDRKNNEEIRNT